MTQAENRNITNLSGRTAGLAGLSNRHSFIGGSDARIIVGDDEPAIIRLWLEKRGEVEPEDLLGNLIVQLGRATEPLNRHWFGDYESALLRLRSIKPRPGCFCFGCRGFRSRRPSPPPFSSMNTIPARSKAAWIASTAARETSRRPFSKSTTVESPRLAASASCDCVISSSPRAARHWAGVIGSTFFVDTLCGISYQ